LSTLRELIIANLQNAKIDSAKLLNYRSAKINSSKCYYFSIVSVI